MATPPLRETTPPRGHAPRWPRPSRALSGAAGRCGVAARVSTGTPGGKTGPELGSEPGPGVALGRCRAALGVERSPPAPALRPRCPRSPTRRNFPPVPQLRPPRTWGWMPRGFSAPPAAAKRPRYEAGRGSEDASGGCGGTAVCKSFRILCGGRGCACSRGGGKAERGASPVRGFPGGPQRLSPTQRGEIEAPDQRGFVGAVLCPSARCVPVRAVLCYVAFGREQLRRGQWDLSSEKLNPSFNPSYAAEQ